MPEFSIIIPIYNKKHYLSKCLDSIKEQSFKDFECIMIDDGSKDSSYDICKSYAEKDSRFIAITKENGGVSSARNLGIDIAKGTFLSFIDPDDYVTPDYLKNLYEPEYDLTCTEMILLDAETNKTEYNKKGYSGEFTSDYSNIAKLLKDEKIESACAKSFRKSLIDKHSLRFPENTPWGEDTLFAVSFSSKCNIILTKSECDYYYIKYGESTSLSTEYSRNFYSYCKIFSNLLRKQLYEDFGTTELSDEFIERILFMYEKTIVFCATVAPELSLKERIEDIRKVIKDPEYAEMRHKSNTLSSFPSYIKTALKTNNATLIVLSAAIAKPIAVKFRKLK